MIDISAILKMFKGKDADNFRAVVQGYKELFEELRKDIETLRSENKELKGMLNNALSQVELVARMEERCLDQNVKNNEVIRNLAEWIIFTERRAEISETIGKLLK